MNPQFGILWQVEHEDILQLTPLASAVPLVVQCSRTAIGSLLNTAQFARIAEPRPQITRSHYSGTASAHHRATTQSTSLLSLEFVFILSLLGLIH